MQRSPLFSMTLRAGALVFAALLSAAAASAELGDVSVRSYIGQQLSADIELVSLTPEDLSGLQVRLAQQNVYQEANITMNPALAGVHMAVVRRDQREFLHITTLQPISADYLHLFLELNAGGHHEVRAATLWLQADPNPAPPPAPLPSAASAAPSDAALVAARARASRPLPAPKPRPVPVAEAAPATAPEAPHEAPAAPVHKEAAAVAPKDLAAAIAAKLPPAKPPRKAQAAPAPVSPAAAEDASSAAPLPLAAARTPPLKGAAVAACAPRQTGITSKECAALDYHNAALSTKLVELEDKLKMLQMALDGKPPVAKPAPAKAAAASASASAAAPAPAETKAAAKLSASTSAAAAKALAAADAALSLPADGASASASASAHAKPVRMLPKLKYKKEKPVEQGAKTGTLVAAGAGVLALLGGLGWWLMKRRKAQGSAPLKIWQGWRKKKPADVAHEPAPPLDEVMPESLLEPE